ncbi:MAG: hypothetical protein IT178_10305 [Acidobacteria bacterium]|nr:hypothetical protein [Acidobacteriota bacterium]
MLAWLMGIGLPVDAATLLASWSFGSSLGDQTNLPDVVAAHLQASPVDGIVASTGAIVPHSYVSVAPGNMAMRLRRGDDGGNAFRFTLSADPGYTFQITDASFVVKLSDSAGANRNVSVWPNADPKVTLLDSAGGDLATTFKPGSFGWKTSNWNAFVLREDLQTLTLRVLLSGNSLNTKADIDHITLAGNVLPTPLPASGLLALAGLTGVLFVAKRRVADDDGSVR